MNIGTPHQRTDTRSKSVFFALSLGTLLFALCTTSVAQEPKKVPRIGFLTGSRQGLSVEGFQRGLRDIGYLEGKNILIEYRYMEGNQNRIQSLVTELVQLKVDVFVSPLPQAIIAAKEATKTIPIVMMITSDPVATGIVDSLARPGGNITGTTRLTRELSGKRLELLKEVVPSLSRVGVLWDTSNTPGLVTGFKAYEAAAHALRISLQSLEVYGPNPDLEEAIQTAVKERMSALITVRTALLSRHRERIAKLAAKNRMASMFEGSQEVEAGGLISYAASEVEIYRRAAMYVDRILKGAKPSDLPVEQPTKFELVVNLKTAKQIGLTIPPNVLARADRVIR